MNKEWIEPQDVIVPEPLAMAVGGHPLVAETLARRGLRDPRTAMAFLDPSAYTPSPPAELPGMERAAQRVLAAIDRQEPICVWGDFDVDGQTSTTILVSTLRALGAPTTYHIPIRSTESHGVNIPNLQKVIDGGARLLLTCDTGIAAHEAVTYARERGVDVIITDHHDLPPTLPDAYAVVNPKLLPDGHSLRELPGAGCAFKLAEELLGRAGRPELVTSLLDLVALGIVADVARQTGDTRYLLQRGLQELRLAQRLGLRLMIETAGLDAERLTEEHIGFELGPRLNALGRLDDANAAVELLTTQDLGRARILVTTLEGLNARRKLLCDQVFQAAQSQIERDPAPPRRSGAGAGT